VFGALSENSLGTVTFLVTLRALPALAASADTMALRQLTWLRRMSSRTCRRFSSTAKASNSLLLRCFLTTLFRESLDNRDCWLISENTLAEATDLSPTPSKSDSCLSGVIGREQDGVSG